MKYRILGKTGLRVSIIGLGGIPIQRTDAAGTAALLDKLEEGGVNFIDTARGYTVSEEYLGAALAGRRDRFILATKAMSRTYRDMRRDIEQSLKNLRTDYIDLYQLHNLPLAGFEQVMAEDGAMAALRDAVQEGIVGHIGATFHSPDALRQALEYPELETVMFPYNIVENQGLEAFALARERGVGVIAMKPMAGGNITDGRLALRYILNNEDCTIAIPGMADGAEAEINLAAAEDISPLTAEELAQVEEWRQTLGGDFCRRCGYCAPCAAGIDIPACFTMANYAERYDLAEWAAGRYAAFAAHAEDCIGCGECEKRCPYQLPIREKLAEVKKIFGR